VNTSIDSVLLPTMSREQDERTRVRAMTRWAIMTSTYIMAPLMIGLACIGLQLVKVILPARWIPCVPYLRIFCAGMLFYPIHTANLNAIKALGRSDLFLQLEIWKKAVGIALLAATIWISVKAMAYSLLFSTFLGQLINSWPNKKLLGYSYLEQVKDMLPQIMLSCLMGAAVFSITFLKLNDLLTLCIQIPFGVVFYSGAIKIMKIESGQYVENIIRSVLTRRKAV
jgi:O-antigen/teichoic acid export membrane protein